MNLYRILRNNKELGPFSLDEIKKTGLKASDLIWIDGRSVTWRFPDEVPELAAQIERPLKGNGKVSDNEHAISKPKKRYRLTADHRIEEITEEGAPSSDSTHKATPPKDDVVPFEDISFGKEKVSGENDFPLEPELDKRHQVNGVEKKEDKITPAERELFGKERIEAMQKEYVGSLPLEPELTSQPVEEFADVDSDNSSDDMEESNKTSGNTGAFILVGLLFLGAIGFWGYKEYQSRNEVSQDIPATDSDTTADSATAGRVDSSRNSFANSRSMEMNDDTLGQKERRDQLKARDSIEQELAKTKLLAARKADSLRKAKADQEAASTPPPNEAKPTDTEKGGSKSGKGQTTEDISKYVRVRVVQPKVRGNGVSGVKLEIENTNNRNLVNVNINVIYFDVNGNIIKESDISAPNIAVGSNITVPVTDNKNAVYVSYKVNGTLW